MGELLESTDVAVIGGGFYGLRIALFLRERLGVGKVLVLEAGPEPMNRASYVNQARVHNGYHYPRSILTGYRSQVNFPLFAEEYRDAVKGNFTHYYGVARSLSKTNARQFEQFCRRIGSSIAEAPEPIADLFDRGRLEKLFVVEEPAFDSRVLRDQLLRRIERAGGISIRLGVRVDRLRAVSAGIRLESPAGIFDATRVISAVYSGINTLHSASELPLIDVQHELTELALVEMPKTLRSTAVTIMDGPFFSLMPFPSRGLHSLSHVRYTPHHRWRDDEAARVDPYGVVRRGTGESRYASMYADVVRYFPAAAGMRHRDSLFEAKTVLARTSVDDSRPILFRADHGLPGYTCVMGGKLDNIYDVLTELEHVDASR